MVLLRRLFLSCFTLLPLMEQVDAAEVHVVEAGDGALVFVDGEIVKGDLLRVMQAAEQISYPIILLRSPGGDASEGMAIGRYLRAVGAATGVAPDFLCASACAMIWAAGTQRYLAPTSLIGFHATYTVDGLGRAEVSGWGNALVGAYLSELGYDETAIFYMTAAGPSDLNWVNRSMAMALGIEVHELDTPGAAVINDDPPQTAPTEEVTLKLPTGFRWIVLESKADPNELAAERWERQLGVSPIVVSTSTGFSAAAVGPFRRDDAVSLMDQLLAEGMIPEDAYLSSGNGFLLRLQ